MDINSTIYRKALTKVSLLVIISVNTQTAHSQTTNDQERYFEIERTITALENFAYSAGHFEVPNSGYRGRGQGLLHASSGRYTNSIAETLLELGYLSLPLPTDPLSLIQNGRSDYDFFTQRCNDRIAVFSKSDYSVPSDEDQAWWLDNNCSTHPIDDLDYTYFQLSKPLQESIAVYDNVREFEVSRVITAFESFANSTGHYEIPDSGYRGRGQGLLNAISGRYTGSVSQKLFELGHLSSPLPKDPLHSTLGAPSDYDFFAQRCEDRVAVFSKSDLLEPSENDQIWWNSNNCSNHPIDDLNYTYFQLSNFLPMEPVSIPGLDENYTLVFEDNFNGTQLDPAKWDTALLWGPYFPINNEEQMYVDTLGMHADELYSPFEFTGSTLKITATAVSNSNPVPERPPLNFPDGTRNPIWKPNDYSEYRYNGPTTDSSGNTLPGYQEDEINYLSGIITSYDSLKMTHGYVETRAKVPGGRGLWPAFWLLTTHYVEDVPEIDVMEFLGQDVDTLYNTYHYFDLSEGYRKISTPSFKVFADDWTQNFHTFGMAWSPNEIIWYVNGEETHRVTDSDYVIANQAMYLIANLAVGGNWPGSPDANTQFPATYEIDYIRAYKRKLNPTLNLSEDYTLQFRDEFNRSNLDPTKWNTHLLWGPYLTINREEQYYVDALGSDADDTTRANTPFVVGDGMLSITARAKNDPNSFPVPSTLPGLDDPIWKDFRSFHRNTGYAPENLNYTSGIITSYDAFKFAYGYAEAKMRLPKGSGLWPAFWLLNGYYVGEQPEIDIIEARGGVPDLVSHNFHTFNGDLNPSDSVSQHPDPTLGYTSDFHLYGVRWQPGRLDYYIDRKIVHTYEDEDFDRDNFPGKNYDEAPVPYQNMYVIANLATGGDFFIHPDDPYISPVDNNAIPASLDIDYIRVWQEKHKE